MPFKYRLQKFLEIRIAKRDEQLQVVTEAQREVARIEQLIEQNNQQIAQTRVDMRKADPRMYEGFDKFLKHLYEKGEKLEIDRQEAERILEYEKEVLKEREKEVNVLEKHKEHQKEEYIKEQNAIELKMLNEVASQKHFAKMVAAKEEAALEELMQGYENEY
jgi:flagellar export protein FliJ